MNNYFAVITKSTDGYFIAEFPDFPEAFTQGRDLEECFIMAQDVLNITFDAYTQEKKIIPSPSKIEEIKEKTQELLQKDAEYTDLSFEPLFQCFTVQEPEENCNAEGENQWENDNDDEEISIKIVKKLERQTGVRLLD